MGIDAAVLLDAGDFRLQAHPRPRRESVDLAVVLDACGGDWRKSIGLTR